jgi:hypothetical protein
MKPTIWQVSSSVGGTGEVLTHSTGTVNVAVASSGSQSQITSYRTSKGGLTITVTIGDVSPELQHDTSARISEAVSGIANAFVMVPHHSADVVTCWRRDFNKVASDFKKVVVRVHERSGKPSQ